MEQWGWLCIAGLLGGVDMPYDIVGKAVDLVTSPLGHLCESFRLCLVLERIAREVDSWEGNPLATNHL